MSFTGLSVIILCFQNVNIEHTSFHTKFSLFEKNAFKCYKKAPGINVSQLEKKKILALVPFKQYYMQIIRHQMDYLLMLNFGYPFEYALPFLYPVFIPRPNFGYPPIMYFFFKYLTTL